MVKYLVLSGPPAEIDPRFVLFVFAISFLVLSIRLSYAGAKDRRALTAQKMRCWRLAVS